MVLYRKYRPQNLDDLIGQTEVKKLLLSAFQNQKLAHAYLFCGPRGTGKTSTARILAKMVNCEEGKLNPCNQCSSCLTITDGSNLDLVEIDAASNRGIDDIRALRETIKLAPSSAKKKVYIIDEVHMLSNEAFNALLKTLEEPPAHALFILATTEVQKIPVTIMSRVQKLDFKLASSEELTLALQKIIDAEKIEIEPAALQMIVKKAAGSFRDGVKLLDQLASSNQKIDVSLVEQSLGTGDLTALIKLLECVSSKSGEKALDCLLDQLNQGVSAKEINSGLLELVHQLLLIKNGLGERLVKSDVKDEVYPELEKLAGKFQPVELIRLIDRLQKSYEQLRFTHLPSLPLEVAVIESSLGALVEDVVPVREVPKAPASVKVATPLETNAVVTDAPLKTDPSFDDDIQKLQDKWSYILETVRQSNYSLEALLRSSKIYECGDRFVTLEVPYAFHQRIIEAPKSREMVETIFADILGRPVRVSTILGLKPVTRDDIANVEVAEDDETIKMVAEIFSSDGA